MVDNLRVDLAKVIQIARKRHGWSQRRLAQEMGVAPSAVAQWELGSTLPTVANRADLSRILLVPFAEMLPELAGKAGLDGAEDPQLLAIMQQVRRVPPPLREALLILVSAAVEGLAAASQPAPPTSINKN